VKNYFGKALPLLLILVFMLLAIPGEADAFNYGNDGSLANPYRIETAEQLALVAGAVYLDKHFILTADIDLSDYLSEGGGGYNDGAGWAPIGTAITPFNGSFDGNGYTISNLFIDRPDWDCLGLFGYTWSSASVENLGLLDVNITGRDYVGGLVGINIEGSIENSSVTGVLKGYQNVGGLAGSNSGVITGSYATGTVTGYGDNAGGLAGRNVDGTITDSGAAVVVTGANSAGGLVGEHNGGTITGSYATGAVKGDYVVGGLAGNVPSASGTITGSYATGAVEGTGRVGGLVGCNVYGTVTGSHADGDVVGSSFIGGLVGENQYGIIQNSYATGALTGADSVGGLVGNNGGGVSNSYALGDVTGYGDYVGGLVGDNDGGVTNSYAVGVVKGFTTYVGGLVGRNDGGTITCSYYDSDASGLSDTGKGEPKTTTEMISYATFLGAGWDFTGETGNGAEDIWGIDESLTAPANDGYPFLAWQGYDHILRPAVTTGEVNDLTATTAAVNGEITYLGYPGNPIQHGVCWSTLENPDTDNAKTAEGAVSATGAFTSSLSELVPGTLYYVRAYATNDAGTVYGEQVQFTTASPGTVNIAAIPGLTVPVTGGSPVTAVTGTDQYTGTVSWEPGHDPFQGETIYTATITLTAKAGFTFDGVAADFFTIAGAETVNNEADSGVVTAVFPATEAAPEPQYITVTSTGPVNGATGVSLKPDITITFSENVEADTGYGGITLEDAGSNTVSISKNISGKVLTVTPDVNLSYSTTYTVTVPAEAVKGIGTGANLEGQYQLGFTVRSAPSGGNSGGGGKPVPEPKPIVKGEDGSISIVNPEAEIEDGTSTVEITPELFQSAVQLASEEGLETIRITIPGSDEITACTLKLPAGALSQETREYQVIVSSGIGEMVLPANMLAPAAAGNSSNMELTMGYGDKEALAPGIKEIVGDRPVIQLTLTLDGEKVAWNNPDAPVTISIPFTPTAAELADPEHITVWYIDGTGNAVAVPNGRYDPATGTVTFTATHFSYYAVVDIHKTFSDLDNHPWARKPIEVMASKGIISGIAKDTYSPGASITRADYLVLLVETLGLTADFDSNFADVEPDGYYYEAAGIAKKLGIANGTGDNRFNPNEHITRQDMMVLTARALEKFKGLQVSGDLTALDKFSDKGEIGGYALESLATLVKEGLAAGYGNTINPLGNTTRAEAAVFLYRIYNK